MTNGPTSTLQRQNNIRSSRFLYANRQGRRWYRGWGGLDEHGNIHTYNLDKLQTINAEYQAPLLDRFRQEIKKNRPHSAKVLFVQDSAACMRPIVELKSKIFAIFANPPSTFFYFLTLKNVREEKKFWSNEVIFETNAYI